MRFDFVTFQLHHLAVSVNGAACHAFPIPTACGQLNLLTFALIQAI